MIPKKRSRNLKKIITFLSSFCPIEKKLSQNNMAQKDFFFPAERRL
jgi:hypothetical protein|tara:strand:- start:508 stop:645 length:138 start_codon:yes stop_codon:yes gene_type:complete